MKRTALATLLFAAAHLALAEEPKAFTVQVSGHGRPMILIPGLASPGEVWDGTVEHFKNRYECHVLSLAGFAGQAPIRKPLLATARKAIAAYIRENKLERPILVGHSLGGFLALAVAVDEGENIGAVIAVDGVPYLPALYNPVATPMKMQSQADALKKTIGAMSHSEYALQSRRSLTSMITRAEDVEAVAARSGESDPATVAEAMADMMVTDLRPAVKRIKAPVLLIGAGPAHVADAYRAQIASVPQHTFALAQTSRHFVMLDDPSFLFATMEAFLR